MKTQMILIVFALSSLFTFAQKPICDVTNYAFKEGEKIEMEVFYNFMFPWTKVGQATLTVNETKYNGQNVFHIRGYGNTADSWSWFYRAEDTYESYVDPLTLKPMWFRCQVKEDNYSLDETYIFNFKNNNAYSKRSYKKRPYVYDTIKISPCTYDVVTIFYIARNLDYSQMKPNQLIPVNVFMDRKLNNIYFRYIGKENVKVKGIGTIRCLKFRSYVITGDAFKEGEHLEIWVSDDQNRIPVRIDTPIIVGSVRAYLKSYSGLRSPFTSKIN